MGFTRVRTVLALAGGRLRVSGWPAHLRLPFGVEPRDGGWSGPPRLRWRAREALEAAGVGYLDEAGPLALDDTQLPPMPEPRPAALAAFAGLGGRGVAVGLPEDERHELTIAAIRWARAAALVVVRDSSAVRGWREALARCVRVSEVATAAEAARTMHWRACRHDLLVVDSPEQVPRAALVGIVDGSAACRRLGLVDDGGAAPLLDLSAMFGSVFTVVASAQRVRRVAMRVSLTAEERAEYDRAFDVFLCAYDRFAAARPGAGFATFVKEARADPRQRESLLAWHRARRIAWWNVGKSELVGALLARHRGARVLVFTPDRASAYELAREHLIAAVTAELPRREREGLLADFEAGRLRALAGPRMLELGVHEGAADVGILVAGGFGGVQRLARERRVAHGGIVYDLATDGTTEIGRLGRVPRTDARPVDRAHRVRR